MVGHGDRPGPQSGHDADVAIRLILSWDNRTEGVDRDVSGSRVVSAACWAWRLGVNRGLATPPQADRGR